MTSERHRPEARTPLQGQADTVLLVLAALVRTMGVLGLGLGFVLLALLLGASVDRSPWDVNPDNSMIVGLFAVLAGGALIAARFVAKPMMIARLLLDPLAGSVCPACRFPVGSRYTGRCSECGLALDAGFCPKPEGPAGGAPEESASAPEGVSGLKPAAVIVWTRLAVRLILLAGAAMAALPAMIPLVSWIYEGMRDGDLLDFGYYRERLAIAAVLLSASLILTVLALTPWTARWLVPVSAATRASGEEKS